MKTLPLLEQDKEKLLSRLSVCDTRDAAVSAMDDELKRILYRAIEASGDEALTTDVQYALATARAALPLIDVNGEIRVYERTADAGGGGAKGHFPVLLAAGAACTAGGTAAFAFLPAAAAATASPFAAAAILIGAALLYIAGRRTGGKHGGMGKSGAGAGSDRHIEASLDTERIYRNLCTILTVIDQNLEERSRELTALPDTSTASSPLPEDEIALLSTLLEAAYADRESPESGGMIADIKYYLHRKGIEVVDFTSETEKHFDRMPSRGTGTLRPALITSDGRVIRKGLSCGTVR